MPQASTWWWIGIGGGVTALVGTGVTLIVRASKRKDPRRATKPMVPPSPGPPVSRPSPSKPPQEPAKPQRTTPPEMTICLKWKSGCSPDEAREIAETLGGAGYFELETSEQVEAWVRAGECQRGAPKWHRRHWRVVLGAIDRQIGRAKERWSTESEREDVAFKVAKRALREVCPRVPLPTNAADIERFGQRDLPAWARQYWDGLWAAFYSNAREMIGPLKA